MKIQVAIDRVSIERAVEIIREIKDYVDIIEIGTSLIKDYGLESVRAIRKTFPDIKILADIKTIDEAEYEFRRVYEAGADIATVMGGSAIATIEICSKVAREYQRDYMIDLLEVSFEKLNVLKQFKDALFCVHLSADKNGIGLEALVQRYSKELYGLGHLAAAGGITIDTLPVIMENHFEVAIIGGAITKAQDIKEAAKMFYEKVRG